MKFLAGFGELMAASGANLPGVVIVRLRSLPIELGT